MSPWIPWLYHYGVGGFVFLACVAPFAGRVEKII